MSFFRRMLLALALALLAAAPVLAGPDYALTILHTNDFHAHLAPFDGLGVTCDQAKDQAGQCQGGVARLAAAIARERAKDGPSLLLDAGDQFQGSLYYSKFKGEPLAAFMNRLGYDAMTVGNHEFDDGPAVLAAFLKALKFPVVAANLDVAASPELRGLIAPLTIREVAGRKIGIVGVAQYKTPEMASPGPNVIFEKTVPAVTKAVAELKAKGVNIIVVLSHAGFETDKKLAVAVPDIDIIVGGHSHVLLGNGYPEAVGPSPLVVPHPGGGPTLIVTAGYWGRYLGVLHATFDAAGRVTRYEGNPERLDASVPEDPDTLAALEAYAKPLEEMRTMVLGQAETAMDAAVCRREECLPGDLLAAAMLATGKKSGAVAALVNGGSIRAGLPAGNVTMGDVLTAYPFPVTLVVVTLTGDELSDILEHSLDRVDQGKGSGRFLQVEGLRYAFDPARPEGSRLTAVQVADTGGWFNPIEDGATYRVAITSFLWKGGDGLGFAGKGRGATDTGLTIPDLVTEYIRGHSPLTPALDGRIQRVAAGK
jgi:5'-nucleotidase / UDP-sugar diphosphatase